MPRRLTGQADAGLRGRAACNAFTHESESKRSRCSSPIAFEQEQNMNALEIALSSVSGHYVVAEGGGGREVLANRGAIGPWETFRLFNRTRSGDAPRHGDAIVLQAANGRYVSAADGGGAGVNAQLGWVEPSTIFQVEKVVGDGEVVSGEQLALRCANGNYVVAEGGGGGAVNANRTARGPWETFTIKIMRPQLVRLRSSSGHYVTAEGGGGAQVTANREGVGLWETFSLLNLSRSDRSMHSGDIVALRCWNGKFIQRSGRLPPEALANANSMTAGTLFVVRARGTDDIGEGARITLQFQASSQYLSTHAGVLVARAGPSDEATFTIAFAERAGIALDWAPDGSSLPGSPFQPAPAAVSGTRDLLVIHYFDDAIPPIAASNEQLRDAIYGRAPSLVSWLHTMSGGTFTVRSAGLYGPVPAHGVTDHSGLWTAAEDVGVPVASFARDGIIHSDRIGFVHVFSNGPGGQTHGGDAVTRRGIRYVGRCVGVGATPDVTEGGRMVLCHEISHFLLGGTDRYGFRTPVRGDVVADRLGIGDWERFVVERVRGPGLLVGGDRLMLRAHDGRHLAVAPAAPNFLNTEGVRAGSARFFTIEHPAGGGIVNGSRVALRASSGRYVTAELGGNSVLTAHRTGIGDWEIFEIQKLTGAGASISSGDSVALKTSGGFFVVAETDARDTSPSADDRRRGYKWGGYAGGGRGGGFDNADANYSSVLLSLYDRLRCGWVRPRYLTPDNRGCYTLRPFIDTREALILFDPQDPYEYYTVENRQYRENLDEVPSSGVVVSWVREDEGYWQWWLNSASDAWPVGARSVFYPAVISAAAPENPPNIFAHPPVLNPELPTRRNDPGAAFTNQELVLPRGNGDPSRFHVSFHHTSGSDIALCIH